MDIAEYSLQYAQTVFRYPLLVFESIINSVGMFGLFLSAFTAVILMIKVISRFTGK